MIMDFYKQYEQEHQEKLALQARVERLDGNAAARDVLAERRRQIDSEGWTTEHDDLHGSGELALAAAVYAAHASTQTAIDRANYSVSFVIAIQAFIRDCWPWARSWWKPADHRRNLIKAGALILAEIERLDRAALADKGE
jgi:hypothetical protein